MVTVQDASHDPWLGGVTTAVAWDFVKRFRNPTANANTAGSCPTFLAAGAEENYTPDLASKDKTAAASSAGPPPLLSAVVAALSVVMAVDGMLLARCAA